MGIACKLHSLVVDGLAVYIRPIAVVAWSLFPSRSTHGIHSGKHSFLIDMSVFTFYLHVDFLSQSHARAVGCAVDDIVLVGSFARDPSSPSLQLHGLLLVGSALLSDGSLAPLPSDANAIASKLDIPLTVSARTRTEAQSLWAHGKIPLFNAVVGNDPGTPLLHIALPADGKGKCTTGAVYLDVC